MHLSDFSITYFINKYFLILSLLFSLISLVFYSLHYLNILYGNSISWTSWLVAIVLLVLSFSKRAHLRVKFDKKEIWLFIFIGFTYFISHLWNFKMAPWNKFGLFDDAAWDIYFIRDHVFNGFFQPAFFDNVGYISRETIFHYYISVFFKIFGYNLLIFNISLIILGFITVLFTTFIIQKLFKNTFVSIVSFLLLNFLPFHYMHIFMGHRYAIAAPLMVISLYFLYQTFSRKSFLKAIISGLFAFLCWSSSVMGKQYLIAIFFSAILIFIINRKTIKKEQLYLSLIWFLAFLISSIPLITYIFFNYSSYEIRESGLINVFFSDLSSNGWNGFMIYFSRLANLFFASIDYDRQFLHDFPLIPFSYFIALIPGAVIAFLKKRYEIILIATIPIATALVSGAYDFRVLLAVPAWIICISYFLAYLYNFHFYYMHHLRRAFLIIVLIIISVGFLNSVDYIWKVSKSPHYQYLLPHKDVAVSRLVQDIVAGSKNPSINMKNNEFNRKKLTVDFDTFVCPYSSYAIMHLYLENFDDKTILSFCDQGIQLLQTNEQILSENISTVLNYKGNKDLKLIWEVSEKSENSINLFNKFAKYGNSFYLEKTLEGEKFTLYVLSIKRDNIIKLKKDLQNEKTVI